MIRAYGSMQAGQPLQPYEFEPGELDSHEVEIDISACGICHSDLSMLNNEWGMTQYPFVPGHESVGRVAAVGEDVSHLQPGDAVGVGWHAGACMVCSNCMSGDHNLCPQAQPTIVGHHGGFAEKLRCQAEFAIPIPDGVELNKAGPLLCGGITVFNPIFQYNVKPTHRVGVIGIGGLGHLALQFLAAWGCEVIAFSSSESKQDEARSMGAHRVVNSRDSEQLQQIAGSLDFIISTVNVSLDWEAYLNTLKPRGRLHIVGAVLEPMAIPAFGLLTGMRSVSGSPVGSPATIATMLDFCARHNISAITEHFPMSQANEALAHLESGKARYRIVLENDWE